MARKKATALPKPEPEMLTVYGDIAQETEDAILLVSEDEQYWLAKSQIEYSGERGDEYVEVSIPDWLVEEKGLVDGQGLITPAAVAAQEPAETAEDITQHQVLKFKGNVAEINKDSYSITIDHYDETKAFSFCKDDLRFEGDDVVDLQVGYSGVDFLVSLDVAQKTGLADFLGVSMLTPDETAPDDPDFLEVDEDHQARPYRHKLRTDTVRAEIELSDAEKIAYGKDLVEHLENEADYKGTASHYSGMARNERKKVDEVIDILKAGSEERSITCDVVADFNAWQLVYVESEWPHREIQRRPMTEKDRQLPLFGTDTPQAAAPSVPFDKSEDIPAPEPFEAVTFFGRLTKVSEDKRILFITFTNSQGNEDQAMFPADSLEFEGDIAEGDGADFTLPYEVAVSMGIIMDEPETIVFYGVILKNAHNTDENTLCFRIEWSDETLTDFFIPKAELRSFGEVDDTDDFIEVSVAYAMEKGLLEGEEGTDHEQERSCGTCAHAHTEPEEGESSPCEDCEVFDGYTPPCDDY